MTKSLAEELRRQDFSGYSLGFAVASVSADSEMDPSELPEIDGMIIEGIPGVDDFGTDRLGFLVVSERVYDVLKRRDSTIEEDAMIVDSNGDPVWD
ncbi:MAG: hypothetical protein QM658_00670 [Gordonia sp. (in: high G+C Gram-positive bacteria)]